MDDSRRSLRPMDPRLPPEGLRHRRPRLRRLPRRMDERRPAPDLHPRRRLLHLLPFTARLHRHLLPDDRRPRLAQERPRHIRVTRRAQHPSVEDAHSPDAGRRVRRIRSLLVASLLHEPLRHDRTDTRGRPAATNEELPYARRSVARCLQQLCQPLHLLLFQPSLSEVFSGRHYNVTPSQNEHSAKRPSHGHKINE